MEIEMLIVGICDDVQKEIIDIKKLINLYNLKKEFELNILTFGSGDALEDHCIAENPVIDIIFSSVENYSFQLTNKVIIPITQKKLLQVKNFFYEYLLNKVDSKTNLKKVK
jgi:hypothetical protein